MCYISMHTANSHAAMRRTNKFRDNIRDLMDFWGEETRKARVAPLDNAVNTKETRLRHQTLSVHATRRLCASNTFFSGERDYARSHPPRRHVPPTHAEEEDARRSGSGVGGGGRGWRNTNTSANFGLLYACWEPIAGPERK